MKHYKAYFFDLYGTLIDIHTDEKSPAFWKQIARFLSKKGAEYISTELQTAYQKAVKEDFRRVQEKWTAAGIPVQCPEPDIGNVFASIYKGKGIVVTQNLIEETAWEFRKTSTTHLRLYDGAKELLIALKESGSKVILLSNAQSLFTLPELKTLEIINCFDKIFISSDWGVKKPSPEFFKTALKNQNLDPQECLMIGNEYICDIEGAAAAQIDTFYILDHLSTKEEKENPEKGIATYFQKGMNLKAVRRRLTAKSQ